MSSGSHGPFFHIKTFQCEESSYSLLPLDLCWFNEYCVQKLISGRIAESFSDALHISPFAHPVNLSTVFIRIRAGADTIFWEGAII